MWKLSVSSPKLHCMYFIAQCPTRNSEPLLQSFERTGPLRPVYWMIWIFAPLHLAVDDGPIIQSAPYQYRSAVLNHNSATEVSSEPHRGAAAVSVPLVNNRKGSLLPPAEPSALRLSSVDSGDPNQFGQRPGAHEEKGRLQRARSLPVKYRYHSNHAILNHRHCKSHPSPPQTPPPPLGVCGRPKLDNSTTKACACQAGVVACVAFLTNDPVCTAVSCETLNIEQAEQDVKGHCVGASLSSGTPPHTSTYSIMVSLLVMLVCLKPCVHLQSSMLFKTVNFMMLLV